MVEFNGIWEFHRVFIVDAVNFCCFNYNFALHLEGEIEGGSIGGQEWPASTAGDDNDATLFNVAEGAAEGVLIDKLIDFDGGQGAGWQAGVVEDISQSNGVH